MPSTAPWPWVSRREAPSSRPSRLPAPPPRSAAPSAARRTRCPAAPRSRPSSGLWETASPRRLLGNEEAAPERSHSLQGGRDGSPREPAIGDGTADLRDHAPGRPALDLPPVLPDQQDQGKVERGAAEREIGRAHV